MIVDYVAAYTAGGGGGPTTPPPTTGKAVKGPGGLCLDVRSSNSASGTPMQIWDCNGSGAQKFTLPQ